MIVALSIGLVVVACVAVLNLALTLAIVKRLRTIEQGRELYGDGSDSLPAVGSTVEGFLATTAGGETVDDTALSHGRQQIIVLSPGCEPCQELADRLIADPDAAEPGALVLIAGSDPTAQALADSLPAGLRIGLDDRKMHMKALSIDAYPAVVTVVDGKVAEAAHVLPKRPRVLSGT